MTEQSQAEPYRRELDVALQTVRTASQVCRSVQATIAPHVLEKQDRSPVTVADFGSQAVICRALNQVFPQDPIMAEEESAALSRTENDTFLGRVAEELERIGLRPNSEELCRWIDHGGTDQYAPRFWTLDPIDGTKGFLRGEQYAISLALIVEGRIEVALLGCPNLSLSCASSSHRAPPEGWSISSSPYHVDGTISDGAEMRGGGEEEMETGTRGAIFYAVRDHGCHLIPLDGEPHATEVHVSPTADAAEARFCESVEKGHTSHQISAQVSDVLGIKRAPYRLDSQAKYAVVARGDADIYLRLPSRSGYQQKVWDHAGGALIVEEAGGTVTDVDGKPLDWTHGIELTANRGIIATNGLLHEQVLAALKKVGIS